jgi:dCTP deaminase
MLYEAGLLSGKQKWSLKNQGKWVTVPGAFLLVSTYEYISVPPDLAIELKLKSSRAREGWNHSLAFWVDPGWKGILTMEIQNITQERDLILEYATPFAQLIVHQLTTPVGEGQGYAGKYQNAQEVEYAKTSED